MILGCKLNNFQTNIDELFPEKSLSLWDFSAPGVTKK
jgi:hypothetical protein